MAKPHKIQTPEQLYEIFNAYKNEVKSNPFIVEDYVGKDAEKVERKKEKPLTIEGLNVYCFKNGIIHGLDDYFGNKNNRYKKYSGICRAIKQEIRQDQIEGGMAGMYNPSITQRLNNLVDKQQIEHIEQPLFSDDSETDDIDE